MLFYIYLYYRYFRVLDLYIYRVSLHNFKHLLHILCMSINYHTIGITINYTNTLVTNN